MRLIVLALCILLFFSATDTCFAVVLDCHFKTDEKETNIRVDTEKPGWGVLNDTGGVEKRFTSSKFYELRISITPDEAKRRGIFPFEVQHKIDRGNKEYTMAVWVQNKITETIVGGCLPTR